MKSKLESELVRIERDKQLEEARMLLEKAQRVFAEDRLQFVRDHTPHL